MIRLLALGGLGISAALAWQGLGQMLPGCAPESDCGKMLGSNWSSWFGIPLSFPGAAVFLAIVIVSLGGGERAVAQRQRRSWGALISLSVLAGAAGVWLAGVQLVSGHFQCFYCYGVELCGILTALLVIGSIGRLPTRRTDGNYRMIPGRRPEKIGVLSILGAGGVALLIFGQFLNFRPNESSAPAQASAPATKALSKRRLPVAIATTQDASDSSAESGDSTSKFVPERPMRFIVGNDDFKANPEHEPCFGPIEAPKLLAMMFDFTDSNSKTMHVMLTHARQRFGDQIAVIMIPVPLDKECNPKVATTLPRHKDSLALTKLALAVWLVDRDAFAKMTDWLFEQQPRTPEEARAYALKLVPERALKKAEENKWIDETIKRNVRWFSLDRNPYIPKVLLTHDVRDVTLRNDAELFFMLERELKIKPAGAATQPATTRPAPLR